MIIDSNTLLTLRETFLAVDSDIENALKVDFDVLAITASHSEYKSNRYLMDVLERRSDLIVFDTVGVFTEEELAMVASKHHLLVLGRGD